MCRAARSDPFLSGKGDNLLLIKIPVARQHQSLELVRVRVPKLGRLAVERTGTVQLR